MSRIRFMNTKTRTRLSPEARRLQLLETAKDMIAADGLQNFTMESLARTAGVTSPLVYNYFSSRQELLGALLQHEYASYREKMNAEVAGADNFEDMVRVFITSNFDHYSPGNIMPILSSQPEIAAAIAKDEKQTGDQIATFLVSNTAKKYQLNRKMAEQVVSMSSGASIAAAEYAAKFPVNREEAIENTLTYILAGLEKMAKLAK